MSMYQKNNNIDIEVIVAVRILTACCFVSLFFTPLFFLAGLILEGVLLGIVGIISRLSVRFLLKPSEEE